MNNILANIPADLSSEIFERLAGNHHVNIERIISKGHHSPDIGWYDQIQNEWVIVLQGSATICFDNKSPVTLNTGDYLNIGAHQKHKVSWTAAEIETIWLAVHY